MYLIITTISERQVLLIPLPIYTVDMSERCFLCFSTNTAAIVLKLHAPIKAPCIGN